ncbi:unnamed protein product [Clavelina lepadiformis]|uniref:Uncharacterized protein n=1 Tax=Clavelina lepadiformis TaxID=159417 RepID=A0ABP0G1E9_CLALP
MISLPNLISCYNRGKLFDNNTRIASAQRNCGLELVQTPFVETSSQNTRERKEQFLLIQRLTQQKLISQK